ncbi:PRRC1-A-like [Homarus americanus]|uniref:PRRC1-A-like n=1 Tax=Homarus americanus TaxID=6706 RepID=A0A8J5JKB0_HOMAM|nr:PRRC1-A-like [Homarus americanus]
MRSMNAQDMIHQAQDVFDRVTHRSSPLLPTFMENTSDTSSSTSSVLTNVAPPSALPSFIASPLSSGALVRGPPPSPNSPSPGSMPLGPAGTPAVGPPVSALGLTPGPPPPSGHSPPPASAPPSLPGSGSTQTLEPSFVPPPSPVTSQPQPPVRQQETISLVTKGHLRHHSYPVYIPGNPMHNPPPPPTPPCLVVQQEQAASSAISKSHSHQYPHSTVEGTYHSREQPYGSPPYVDFFGNSVSYGSAYPPHSQGSVDASVDLGSPGVGGPSGKPGGNGWFGWIRGTVSSVGHRVAERAKTSMDTMITTLDPQMKEYIHSGGDMDILVASDKEIKVGGVREAFQFMFGKATVSGMAAQAESVAAQPVGFEAALHSAEERINSLRTSGRVHPQQPVVSVENFIVELTPDCWFDVGLLLLDDPGEDILLQTYTQVTPIPPDFVTQAKNSTPDDYPYKSSGFAATVGQIASQNLEVHHTMWQETLTGVSRREMIVLAARALAGLYKSRLPHFH